MSKQTRIPGSSYKMMKASTLPVLFSSVMITIFILTTGFTEPSNENSTEENVTRNMRIEVIEPCTLDINAGEDQEICLGEEVRLTANATNASECNDCNEYGIENTDRCDRNDYYVLWLNDNNRTSTYSNVNLVWKEFDDGTATLKGKVVDNSNDKSFLEVDVIYSGRTTNTPANSPKDHFCNQENANGWVYYTGLSGTIRKTDGSWSFNIARRGPAFQLGNGANSTEDEVGRYGASGWFDARNSHFDFGDFNFNLGDCINPQSSEIEYLWSTGETAQSITVSPTEDMTYSVTVKDCKDCEASDEVIVIVNNANADIGADQEICLGYSITLTAGGEGTYLWSTGETTASIIVSPDVTTTYGVTVTNTGCEASDEVVVTVNSATADIGADQEICLGYNITLTAGGEGTYLWSTGEITASIIVSPDVTTTYGVTVTNNGCTASDEVVITVNNATADIGVDQDICLGDSITLTAGGEGTYLWSTGETTASIIVSPDMTTTYDVTVTNNGCTASDEVVITVNNATADIGVDQDICLSDSITLTAGGEGTYLWSTGETTASIIVSPDMTTTYGVTVTNNGCEASDEVVVTVNNATADIGVDQNICLGDSITLTAGGEGTYLWSTGEATASIIVSPDMTTTYGVTVTNNGCEASDEVVVTVNNATADIGVDQDICLGDSITLTSGGEGTYLWSTGETTASITVSPGMTTTYGVMVTNNGCEASDEVIVTVNNANADIGADQEICLGDSITLNAGGEGTYLWSTGETTASITVSPVMTITYGVTVTNKGCKASDEVVVTVNNATADIGSDQDICLGDSITLTAEGEGTYLWTTGETTPSITISPTVTTTYGVTVTNNGCEASDEVVVTVNSATADIGADQDICFGDTIRLMAGGEGTFLWTTGETKAFIDVSPIRSTTYGVTVTNNGCESSDEVMVNVTRVRATAGEDVLICSDGDTTSKALVDVTLTADGGDSYLWSTGETTQSIVVSPEVTTTYTVIVTKNGCTGESSVSVIFRTDCNNPDTFGATIYPTVVNSMKELSINFVSEKDQSLGISLFDLSGNRVGSTFNGKVKPGKNTIGFDMNGVEILSEGIYLIRIIEEGNAGKTVTKKIILKNRR